MDGSCDFAGCVIGAPPPQFRCKPPIPATPDVQPRRPAADRESHLPNYATAQSSMSWQKSKATVPWTDACLNIAPRYLPSGLRTPIQASRIC
jgi:hypothetical protein